MGTIQHKVVIATYSAPYSDGPEGHISRKDLLSALNAEACDPLICVEDMLVGPVSSPANGYISYILTTDGSKLGWATHELGNDLRKAFYDYMLDNARHPEIVEVSYGELGTGIEQTNCY
jgi:hypothetical protein